MNKIKAPDVSVIIPCYNAGAFLQEAVNSVYEYCKKYSYEIIITNDGSTDPQTVVILNELSLKTCTVLHQENRGPAAARNTAVKASSGEYLFFLDSDNKARKGYIDKGIEVLKANNDVGVVYGKPFFFGENAKPRFYTKAFDFDCLLFDNYIDTCTVIRRKVWDDVGGFDEARVLYRNEV